MAPPKAANDALKNSGMSETEHKLLMFHHFNILQEKDRALKEAQKDRLEARKRARGDGLVMKDLDYMARCAELEDPEIVPQELARMAQIASWFSLPVNYQPDMFVDRTPLVDRAYEEGKTAALLGRDEQAPYGPDSKAGQSWISGYREGHRLRHEELASALEKAARPIVNDEPEPSTEHEEPQAENVTKPESWNKSTKKAPPPPEAA